MAEKREFRAIKGTRDILPPESALWNRVEQAARELFAAYGFGEIQLPIFEQTELFARSIGAETDVVSKEMYTFGDHDLPELEELKTSLVFQGPNIHAAEEVISYAQRIEDFQRLVASALKEKKIVKTPDNVWAKDLINVLRTQLLSDADELQKGDSLAARRVRIHMESIREALGTFRFGSGVTLRPEATASVCRAYIEHGMHTWPQPVKLYYMGPMFRRERPQKGRYRQFYQIGAEVLTSSREEDLEADARVDAEVIEMLMAYFERVGLEGTTLYLNSIGCKECRPKYVAALRAELERVKGNLGADSQRRIGTNPLRVLDSKVPEEQPIIEKLPKISDYLCQECRDHFMKLQEELKLRRIAYEINWRLVRGLDYYMRTTFEITAKGLGAQNAVCGGGRYDGLVELLGGPPTKGIGFAIGTDRVILSLEEAGKVKAQHGPDVFIAWMGAAAYPVAVAIARKLRREGLSVELPLEEMKIKKSLGLADKVSARYALILGEDEVAKNRFTLKRLADAEQKSMTEPELLEYLESERRGLRG